MTAILAAKALKGIYSVLKDGGAGTDPAPTAGKVWTLLTPFQRVDWMKMSGAELNIIYCGTDWPSLPLEHRVRLCGSLLSMVDLFARIGAAKEQNGLPKVPGSGSSVVPGKADVSDGLASGAVKLPG